MTTAADDSVRHIVIPACEEHAGFSAIHADVPWHCIYCGAQRGEPFMGLSYDGSRRLAVTQWNNPCGHIEIYVALRQWLKFQAEVAQSSKPASME
jgi:hypothetical protein